MRAGGFIPPEMNIESTNNFTTTIQRHNEPRTIAIPILLSVTQRNVLLRPSDCLITHYSLRRGRRAGDIVGRSVNGYHFCNRSRSCRRAGIIAVRCGNFSGPHGRAGTRHIAAGFAGGGTYHKSTPLRRNQMA